MAEQIYKQKKPRTNKWMHKWMTEQIYKRRFANSVNKPGTYKDGTYTHDSS
jgi:hypothetical protein